MFKKMFKGIYIVAFLLFVAGFFCLFPIGNNKNEIENSTSQTEAAGDLPSTGPSIVEPMAAKQSTTSYYGIDKSKIYLISSPSDLAWVAHAINNSSSTSLIKNNGLGYYFIQTQDIDLKNEMWTPIGTEKNPFQGIYYGEGYKISNIDIHSSAAATYIGLFGKTDAGAVISDVVLAGEFKANVTKEPTAKGTLVGSANTTYLINCHDTITSKKIMINNASSTELSSVGTHNDNVPYFKGTTFNGKDAAPTQNLTFGKTNSKEYNLYAYHLTDTDKNNGARFYKENVDETEAHKTLNGGQYVFWYCEKFNLNDTTTNFDRSVKHSKTQLTLRGSASATSFYVRYEGHKANNLTITEGDTTYRRDITFDTVSPFQVTFNYGYGSKGKGASGNRNYVEKAYVYDQPLQTYYNNHTWVFSRLGYTLAAIKVGNDAKTYTSYHYKNGFLASGNVCTLSWTYGTQRQLTVKIGYDSSENAEGMMKAHSSIFNDPTGVIKSASGFKSTSPAFEYQATTTSGQDGFANLSITLKPGFEIASTSSTAMSAIDAIEFDSTSHMAKDKRGNTTLTSTSGIYHSFINSTGECNDSDAGKTESKRYKTSSSGGSNNMYDFYQPFVTTATAKAGTTQNKYDLAETTYTFTVQNMYAAGTIYLIIRRVNVEVDVSATYASSNASACYKITIDTASGYNSGAKLTAYNGSETVSKGYYAPNNRVILTVKYGEKIKLKYRICDATGKDTEDAFIVNFKKSPSIANKLNQTINKNSAQSYSGKQYPVEMTVDTSGDIINGISDCGIAVTGKDEVYIHPVIASMETSVKISLVDTENKKMSDQTATYGHDLTIHFGYPSPTSKGYRDNDFIFVNLPTNQISVKRNGYWKVKEIKVSKLDITNNEYKLVSTETTIKEYTPADALNNYLVVNCTLDEISLDDKKPTYEITVVFERRTFTVDVEYEFDYSDDTTRDTTTLSSSNPSTFADSGFAKYFEGTPVFSFTGQQKGAFSGSFKLTALGRNVLKLESVTETNQYAEVDKNNLTTSGYLETEASCSSTDQMNFTLSGTIGGAGQSNDTTCSTPRACITIKFSYRTIKVNLNSLYNNTNHTKLKDLTPVALVETSFKISDDGTLTYQKVGNYASIAIDKEYYLTGWYIKNGEYETTSFRFISNGGVITKDENDTIAGGATWTNNDTNPVYNIGAIVADRTVSFNYNAGAAGSGKLFQNTNTAYDLNNVTLSETVTNASVANAQNLKCADVTKTGSITLKAYVYFNLGYQILKQGYTIEELGYTTSNFTDNFKTQLSTEQWEKVFKSNWTDFAKEDSQKTHTFIFKALWTPVEYSVVVDNNTTSMPKIQVGQEIGAYYNANEEKLCKVYYNFNKKGFTNYTSDPGHIATGYTLSQGATASGAQKISNNSGSPATITLSANILNTIKRTDWYKYTTDGLKIILTTQRKNAPYKITIEKNDHYTLTLDTNANGYNKDIYTQDAKGNISVVVIYSENPDNFKNAINKIIKLSRVGYKLYDETNFAQTFIIKTSDGSFTDPLSLTTGYNFAYDITVLPRWKVAEQANYALQAVADWTADAKTLTEKKFYLLKEHDIISAFVKGKLYSANTNVVSLIGDVLANGDKVTKVEIIISGTESKTLTFTAKNTTANANNLNLKELWESGNHTVKVKITVKDCFFGDSSTYNANKDNVSYTHESNTLTFTMEKNQIYFADSNLQGYFTGSNSFVPVDEKTKIEKNDSVVNDFGNFYYHFDWKGGVIAPNAEGITKYAVKDKFETGYTQMTLISGTSGQTQTTFEVGGGYGLKLKAKTGIDSQTTLFSVSNDQVSNVTSGAVDLNSTTSAGHLVTINKTKIKISFTNGSLFFIAGQDVLVWENKNGNISVTHGNDLDTQIDNKIQLQYKYSRIYLSKDKIKQPATSEQYKGQMNHALDEARGFVIKDFEVKYTAGGQEHSEKDPSKNFEWIIDEKSVFTIYSASSALQYTYISKFLTAKNGALEGAYSDKLQDKSVNVKISDIKLGETAFTPTLDQFTFTHDNKVILTVSGYNTPSMTVIINRELAANLTFKISLDIDATDLVELKKFVKFVGYIESTTNATALGNLSFGEGEKSLKDDYSESKTVTNGTNLASGTYYGVITDVAKVKIDYNTGSDPSGSGDTQKIIYLSKSTGEVQITNPKSPKENYIKFDGYHNTLSTSALTIESKETDGHSTFSTSGASNEILVKAKWKIVDFGFEIASGKNKLTYWATREGIDIDLVKDGIATLDVMDGTNGTKVSGFQSVTYTLATKEANSFTFSASSTSTPTFHLADDSKHGFAYSGMSGKYTITIVVSYSDGTGSAVQSHTETQDIDIEIKTNIIELSDKITLTYNNKVRNNTEISVKFNDQAMATLPTIAQLPTADDSKGEATDPYHFYISISGEENKSIGSEQIKNAGTYTITATIQTYLKDLYQFKDNKDTTTITITINQYEIKLHDYEDQIAPFKYFGENDPNPIKVTIQIQENDDNVELTFTRNKEGTNNEAIGTYALSSPAISDEGYKKNYKLTETDFSDVFEIKAPSGKLQVKFEQTKITYEYNGYAATNPQVTCENDKYKLTFNTNGASSHISVTFTLTYEGTSGTVQIPESEREKYAGYVVFATNATKWVNTPFDITVDLTQAAKDLKWTGIEIVTDCKIEVTQKTLKVTAVEKTYDSTNSLVFDTTDDSVCTSKMTLEGLVEIPGHKDKVRIEGLAQQANVGENITITSLALIDLADVEDESKCYTLDFSQAKVKILADKSTTIAIDALEKTFDYGTIKEDTTHTTIADTLLKLYYTLTLSNNGERKAVSGDFTVSSIEIVSKAYSTGKYLKVGTYTLKITVKSKNYTFNGERQAVEHEYEHTYENIQITIEKIDLHIKNSTKHVTKPYDESDKVLDEFVQNKVTDDPAGYFTSDKLAGDVIRILSGTYDNKLVGNGKKITLVYDSSNDDSNNYNIHAETLVGDITSVTLYFKKNHEPESKEWQWVDDKIEDFTNTDNFTVVYDGDINKYINAIIDKTNFMERWGYTQESFSYKGLDLRDMLKSEHKKEAEELLAENVTKGSENNPTEIHAIWKQNTYTVTLVYEHAKVTDSTHGDTAIKSFDILYFDHENDINIVAETGYKYSGFTFTPAEGYTRSESVVDAQTTSGDGNKTAAVKIKTVRYNLTIKLNITEINVRIKIDYNLPKTGTYIVTSTWGTNAYTGGEYKDLKYTELDKIETKLPTLKLDRGYRFKHWTLNGTEIDNNTKSIWELINGDTFVQDNLDTGFTFTANWEEMEVYFTISAEGEKHFEVEVKMTLGGGEAQTITLNGENKYKVLYTSNITISITSNEFYKWTKYTYKVEKENPELGTSHSSTAANVRTGTISVTDVRENFDITISTAAIKIDFVPTYETPLGTVISADDQPTNGSFEIDKDKKDATTLDDVFNSKKYKPSDYTYDHTGWTYGKGTEEYKHEAKVTDVVKKILGDKAPDRDSTFTLKAFFTGKEYTVTFKIEDKESHKDVTFEGGSKEQQKTIHYGTLLTNEHIPALVNNDNDEEVVWVNSENNINEIFNAGTYFILTNPRENLAITLTATWGMQKSKVHVIIDGKLDKFNSLDVDWYHFGEENVKDGNQITFDIEVFTLSIKIFKFDLDRGYEVGDIKFAMQKDSEPTEEHNDKFQYTNNNLTVKFDNFDKVDTIKITIRARQYTITIEDSKYYKFKNNTHVFNIDYDANVGEILKELEITRDGYVLEKLMYETQTFAEFDATSKFTYKNVKATDETDIVTSEGVWNGLESIELTVVWKRAEDSVYQQFLKAETTAKDNLVYNGDVQTIAETTVTVNPTTTSKEENKFEKNNTLTNGDRIVDFYYTIDSISDKQNALFGEDQKYQLRWQDHLEQNAHFVIIVEDFFTKTQYTINYTTVQVKIAKTKIEIKDAKLESYYTGSEYYAPTKDKDLTQGSVVYESTDSPNGELSIIKVELYGDESKEYAITEEGKDGYAVKYYFNNVGNKFKKDNYDGLEVTGENDSIIAFVTEENQEDLKCKVIKAIISLHFDEQGFENGKSHYVTLSGVTDTRTEHTEEDPYGFVLNIESIKTQQHSANVYSQTKDFEISAKVTRNNEDKSKNFDFVLAEGSKYEIISKDKAYRIDTKVKYFNPTANENEKIKDQENGYKIKLLSYSYSTTETKDTKADSGNYKYNGQLLMSVFDNGSGDVYILVSKEMAAQVTLHFEVNGTLSVLTWAKFKVEDKEVDNFAGTMTTTLNELEEVGSRQQDLASTELTSNMTYVAVVTDYKAVKYLFGDLADQLAEKNYDMGYVYIQQTKTVGLNDPDTTKHVGFDFVEWASDELSQLTVEEKTLKTTSLTDITKSSVTAVWKISTPTFEVTSITEDALVEYHATITKKISDVSAQGVTNSNTLLTYKFEILRNGLRTWHNDLLTSTDSTFTFLANTTTNGQYKLKVYVSFKDYTVVTDEKEFTITINRLNIKEIKTDTTSYTYANRDFIADSDIQITFTSDKNIFSNSTTITEYLKDILTTENRTYYITGVTEIKNHGTYILSLVVDETVFEQQSVLTITIEVKQYELKVGFKDDHSNGYFAIPDELRYKIYGFKDPEFVFKITAFEGKNPEDVTITLERESNEINTGTYKFKSKGMVDEGNQNNYFVTVQEDATFTIKQAEKLKVIIDNDLLSMVYAKTHATFGIKYDTSSGKWILSLGNTSSTLTLQTELEGQWVNLIEDVYENALVRLKFEAPQAITVQEYDGSYIQSLASDDAEGATANYKSITFEGKFFITKYMLSVKKIEKFFDRTTTITPKDAEFVFIYGEEGDKDEVYLTGNYSQETVGANLKLSNMALAGKDAGNYDFDPNWLGEIKKATLGSTNVSFDLVKKEFVYGKISSSSNWNDIKELAGFTFTIAEYTTNVTVPACSQDIEKGYVYVESVSYNESELSTAKLLKVGNEQTITFKLNSDNFTDMNKTFTVKVKITTFALDLSSLNSKIIRKYKENDTKLPTELSESLEGFIFEGDEVTIDKEKSRYSDDKVGENKHVEIVLAGTDAGNYTVVDNVLGTITTHIIVITVVADQADEGLVTHGTFKEDNATAYIPQKTIELSYPTNSNYDILFTDRYFPQRVGYEAKSWKYKGEDETYVDFTKENIEEVFKSIVEKNPDDTTLSIYTVWEIKYFEIVVKGEHIKNKTLTAEPQSSHKEDGGRYLLEYYDSLSVSVELERGFKIKSFSLINGTVKESELNDLGKASGTFTLTNVQSAIEVVVYSDEILVSVLADVNLPSYTERTDTNSLLQIYKYSELESVKQDALPDLTVLAGTYHRSGYTYNNGTEIGEKSLKEIVDELHTELIEDVTINIKAVWTAEQYKVTFEPNDGKLDSGELTTNATYAQAIEKFPQVSMKGKNVTWVDKDNKEYVEKETLLTTIGVLKGDVYEITLFAVWTNAPQFVSITIEDKLTLKINGVLIDENAKFDEMYEFELIKEKDTNKVIGGKFKLIYETNQLQVEVTADAGYYPVAQQDKLKGEFEDHTTYYIVKNLFEESTLTFIAQARDNKLTIYTTHVKEGFTAKAGEDELELTNNYITAKTGQVVTLTFNAEEGYEFDANMIKILGGVGNIEITIAQDNRKTVTVIWQNFTSDETLTVDAVPATIQITIGDVSSIFLYLNIGQDIDLKGGMITAKTGDVLKVTAYLTYGYTGGTVSTTNGEYVEENSIQNTYRDGYYILTATISGFNKDFTIQFNVNPREYKFVLKVAPGQENLGSITSEENQTVKFGADIDLNQKVNDNFFEFANWSIEDLIISTQGTDKYKVTNALKSIFDKLGENATITIYANYVRKERTVKIVVVGNGYVTATQEGRDEEIEIQEQGEGKFLLGLTLDITLHLPDGYEFDYLRLDDKESNPGEDTFTFDKVNNIIKVVLALENTVQEVQINIRACDVDVLVTAGTFIKFNYYPGTTTGGTILLTDAEGNEAEDDEYHYVGGYLGNLFLGTRIVGAKYIAKSHTDGTLYFVLKANEGYEPHIDVYLGIISSKRVGDTIVYEITGIREGTRIEARFSAEENDIDFAFVDGRDESEVYAGVFEPFVNDLVSSNPTKGSFVQVSVVSGEKLRIDAYTSPAFSFEKTTEGKLRYAIEYPAESKFENITVSEIVETDIEDVGFSYKVSIEIPQVLTSAKFKIYVIPKDFHITLKIDEDHSVTLNKTVRYGDEWTIKDLPSDQNAIVHMKKPNMTFNGFYTKERNEGDIYVDRYYDVVKEWLNTGYRLDGKKYVLEENYDPETDTFTIFAGYIAQVANVTIKMLPASLAETGEYSIKSFASVTKGDWWPNSTNIWTAEVVANSTITFSAPKIDGFTFTNFKFQIDGGETYDKGSTFTLSGITEGDFVLTAIYQPNYNIAIKTVNSSSTDSGVSYIRQNGVEMRDSFDSQTTVTLVAIANEGYNFKYWLKLDALGQEVEDVETNRITGVKNEAGEFTYSYEGNIEKPIYLIAVFEGKTVNAHFIEKDLGSHHTIKAMELLTQDFNGVQSIKSIQDRNAAITALVGDQIIITVEKAKGYGFDPALFNSTDSEGIYTFTYTFNPQDMTLSEDGTTYEVSLSIFETKENVAFEFNLVMNESEEGEIEKAASMYFIDLQNNITRLKNGEMKNVPFGDAFTFRIEPNTNYVLVKENCLIVIDDVYYSITDNFDGNSILVNEEFMNRWFDGMTISFEIEVQRLIWSDEEAVASGLDGMGTPENPFLIRTVRDFALAAYNINNGLTFTMNEGQEDEQEVRYADCAYKVVNDIDFKGRYWEPIGTEANPFNGTFNLGGYEFKNVTHYRSYSSPKLSYQGIFWHVTKEAHIIQSHKTFTVMIICICVSVVVIIGIIILILILAKKRKRKLEDIANQ